ncbi:unnamed protein product [Strongylus vulgaris]|uniref:Uncharacterized protein n=1 Tax=Strongylus vulgaris TaxID=40348 RepID=A0A3P7JC24_STRVU|nr:unnamed protein product [Strongylus vulgaris]
MTVYLSLAISYCPLKLKCCRIADVRSSKLVIRSNPIALVISVTSCCAEMAIHMFVFVWAPLFIRAEHKGTRVRELPFLTSDWTETRFERVFICLVIFEMACGVYSPAMEALQTTVLPFLHQRSVLLALVRLPLTFFVSLSILTFFPTPGGEFKLMIFIVVQLFIAALLSLLLDAVVMSRGYEQDPDHFYLPTTLPHMDLKQPSKEELDNTMYIF